MIKFKKKLTSYYNTHAQAQPVWDFFVYISLLCIIYRFKMYFYMYRKRLLFSTYYYQLSNQFWISWEYNSKHVVFVGMHIKNGISRLVNTKLEMNTIFTAEMQVPTYVRIYLRSSPNYYFLLTLQPQSTLRWQHCWI